MKSSDPLIAIKGVGEALAHKCAMLGIDTVADLIEYYPKRYEDYTHVESIAKIKPGVVTIKATIKQSSGRYVRRGMHITEAVASDETGSVRIVWFNQPYRSAALKANAEYFISGQFGLSRQRLSLQNPSAELVSDFPISSGRVVPVYRLTKGLTSLQLRRLVRDVTSVIEKSSETLPKWLVADNNLISRAEALLAIHFPESLEQLETAKRRLGFEEVFQLVLAALLNKNEQAQIQAHKIVFSEKRAKEFVANLPFTLTDAQRRAVWKIYQDLQAKHPMNRLLEGDVGSGKTVVACMAALPVLDAGKQVAYMAPTELLAMQHANSLQTILKPLGLSDSVVLLIGGLTPKQKQNAHQAISEGRARFIVGTHALIEDTVVTPDLELVIIDEQHRFGVEQRKKLQAKAKHMPHVLSMTATPIPRSLALTLYGELDISILDTKPAGRKAVITKLMSPNGRERLYGKIDGEITKGRQVFVVCPLVTDSDVSDLRSAESVYEELRKKYYKHRTVELLHGRMKSVEKDKIMRQFVDHKIDILVATTVIEVGVDVPNASVMVVEDAERFGLAQLHQLRGRVGRSEHQGYCYLMMSDSKAPSKRLRALESSTDGFRLAELDLDIRGPGAIYGTMQHGDLDLRVAKLSDVKLIASARDAAQLFIDRDENLLQYKELQRAVTRLRAVTNLN